VSLIAVHRVLILSFIALAVVFGLKMLSHYRESGSAGDLWGALLSGAVVVLGLIYVLKAPYLRRK